jgi:hypothetical protein
MTTTTFDPSEGVSTEQQNAETAALAQGEKIAQMEQEDRDKNWERQVDDDESAALIGGKFKSQDDLLKAYEELQSKLGKRTEDGDEDNNDEEPLEEGVQTERDQETEEVLDEGEVSETVTYMEELSKEYDEAGDLSPEAIQKLATLAPEELIKSYLQYQRRADKAAAAATMQQAEVVSIQQSVGGVEAYNEMINWAASNLTEQEITDFNSIANGTNVAAAKFAVEALSQRYKANEGFEAPLLTGKSPSPRVKGYRSQAELARDIANPLYSSDPAFREDVEERLRNSADLL